MSNSGLLGQDYQSLNTVYVERLIIGLNFRKINLKENLQQYGRKRELKAKHEKKKN